jgi:hypothetical protein
MVFLWDKLKEFVQEIESLTIIFIVLFVIGFAANGLYAQKFDLTALTAFYGAVATRAVVKHGIDSALNSTKGEMPAEKVKQNE